MNILIIVPRSNISNEVNYKYLFPLGLAYISSVLKDAGYDVDCLNLNHYSGTVENLVNSFIISKEYNVICTGGLSTSYKQIKMVTDAVHSSGTKAKLILGGGAISSEPELMFNALKPDYIVLGEGEKTIIELVDCIRKNSDIKYVDGIGYVDDNDNFVCTRPQLPIENLDSIPLPDFEGFEFAKYLDNMQPSDMYFYDLFDNPRIYPIVCSRSCPFLCTFCFHPVGNKYRQRSVDSIIHELSVMIKRYHINAIAVYDELFSNNREWLFEFCRRVKGLSSELSWECKWSCQMRVDKLDEEMLKVMKDSGCYMVSYGFESYSPSVLKSMKKHITQQQIKNAVDLTFRQNISIQANFIFGDSAETPETVKETLTYWKKNSYVGIMLDYVNPYPGTELYKNCIRKTVIKDKLDFIENHIYDIFNMSDTMTDKEFERMKYDIYEAKLKCRDYVVPKKLTKCNDNIYVIKIKCPHCKETMEYKNYTISHPIYFFYLMYCRNCRKRFFLVSRLYKVISKTLVLLLIMVPIGLKIKFYKNLNKIIKLKPLIKKYILKPLKN
ncbi:MAG TPA: hypothetical protein DCE80_01210 [Ignavibacteriales bacterium]|nr:hypothetical protein [Ignavibacteriales bacterium]